MLNSKPFTITEWDWLQVELRLLFLELRGPKFVTTLQFRDEKDPACFHSLQLSDDILLVCQIHVSTTTELVKKVESRQKQLEFYRGWVNSAKTQIKQTLGRFSALATEFSVERNAAFLILDDYGMGSAEVCRFIGNRVIWASDRIQKTT